MSRDYPPVSLFGVPTDVGAAHRGASMGPEALRVATLAEAIARRGVESAHARRIDVEYVLPPGGRVGRAACRPRTRFGQGDPQAGGVQQMQGHERPTGTATDDQHIDGCAVGRTGHGCGHEETCEDGDAQYPIRPVP